MFSCDYKTAKWHGNYRSYASLSSENTLREERANEPVGHIYNFAKFKIDSYATEHVGIRTREAVSTLQVIKHMSYRVARCLHEIRPDTICGIVRSSICTWGQWTTGQ